MALVISPKLTKSLFWRERTIKVRKREVHVMLESYFKAIKLKKPFLCMYQRFSAGRGV